MRLTYTLLFFLLFCQKVICQRTVIQDTFYYKSGEMIVGKMFQEENLGQITVYVSYVRGGTNERYVRLKVPKKWTDQPSIDKAFFREMLNDSNGISIYWVDHTQPQFDRIPLVLPVPGGVFVGAVTIKALSESYYYMKKGELFRFDDNEKQCQKLFEKLAVDCPALEENVAKKSYSSKDMWKFAKDFNAGCM
jgi:hypothetical protein